MSTVFYRWGAGRDESRVTFDGTHISVFDLKREVILANKMGNGKDFDLGLFDNVTGEELKDDNHQIPRSSSLIARRLPASAKGRGNAQNYIVGTTAADALNNDHRIENHARDALTAKANKGARFGGGAYGSMSKRFDGRDDAGMGGKDRVEISTGDAEEDKRIQAFFAQSGDQWEQTQEDMSMAPGRQAQFRARQQNRPAPGGAGPSGTGGGGGGGGGGSRGFDYSMPPDKEPPVGYICYRCGQKGHWIQDCPTNDDPANQDRKRFVRVTGIPRSFLKTVEAPVGAEGSSGGAMLTADGGFVMAMPDQRQWQKHAQVRKRNGELDLDANGPPPDLVCYIDRSILRDAVQTPCCRTAFCEECITTHLVEHDFECPQCESKVASLDKLRPDEEKRERVSEFKKGKEEERVKAEAEEGTRGEEGVEVDEAQREKAREAEDTKSEPEEGAISATDAGPSTSRPAQSVANSSSAQAISSTPSASSVKPVLDPVKMREMLNPQTMQNYTSQVTKMLQNPTLLPQAKALLQAQMQLVQTTVAQMQVMGMLGIGPAAGQPSQQPNQPGGGGGGRDQQPNGQAGPGRIQQGSSMPNQGGNMNMLPAMPPLDMMNGGMGGMMPAMLDPQQQAAMMGMNQNPMQMGMGMGVGMGMGMGMGMPQMGMGMQPGQMGMNMGMGGGGGNMGHMGMGGPGRGRGGFPRGGGQGFRGRGNYGGGGGGGSMGRGGGMQAGMPGGGRAPLPKRQADDAGLEVAAGVDKSSRTH